MCPEIFRFVVDLHLFSPNQFQLIADKIDFLLRHHLLPVDFIQIHDLGSQILIQVILVKV